MFSSRPAIIFLMSSVPLRSKFIEKQDNLAIFSCDLPPGEVFFPKLWGRTAAKNVIEQVKSLCSWEPFTWCSWRKLPWEDTSMSNSEVFGHPCGLHEYNPLKNPNAQTCGERLISYTWAELDLDRSEVGRKWRKALGKIYSCVRICKNRCCICISQEIICARFPFSMIAISSRSWDGL